ncbi:uncharacterized protein, partial [Prorops nasuta]
MHIAMVYSVWKVHELSHNDIQIKIMMFYLKTQNNFVEDIFSDHDPDDPDYVYNDSSNSESDNAETNFALPNSSTKSNNRSVTSCNISSGIEISPSINTSGRYAPDDKDLYVNESRGRAGDKKKNCCLYCKKLYTKIVRHYETVHRTESEVQTFINLPKRSVERKQLIDIIRKRGNFNFNTDVNINKGELIVSRRPRKDKNKHAADFSACPNCKGFFAKTSLRHHFKRCTTKNSRKNRSVQILGRAVIGRIHESANKTLRKVVFPVIREDEICRTIRYDELVIRFANKLCIKYRLQHQHDMIRAKIRLLGRYLIALRQINSNITDFSSLYDPRYYDDCISAIHTVAQFDERMNAFKHPATASAIGTLLKQIGKYFITLCIKNHEEEKKKETENFLELLVDDFGCSVNKTVFESQMMQKRKKKVILPSSDDILKLYKYLEKIRTEAIKSLNEKFTMHDWRNLIESTLISIQVFNRRRAGEIERVSIEDIKNAESLDKSNPEVFNSLSERSKCVARKYKKFTIRGKLGRSVSVLLSDEISHCIDLILKYRRNAKVPSSNNFLFGIPSYNKTRHKYLRACNLLRKYSIECGAKSPFTLRGTELRKHIATKCISLNLTDTE